MLLKKIKAIISEIEEATLAGEDCSKLEEHLYEVINENKKEAEEIYEHDESTEELEEMDSPEGILSEYENEAWV